MSQHSAVILAVIISINLESIHGSLFQLSSMLSNAGFSATSFLAYGCYCGSGSTNNHRVVDCLDQCCYQHDYCYNSVAQDCPGLSSYFASYIRDTDGSCIDAQDRCKYQLCDCDYVFVQCLLKHKKQYSDDCQSVRRTICLTLEHTPPNCNFTSSHEITQTEVCTVQESATVSAVTPSTTSTTTISRTTVSQNTSQSSFPVFAVKQDLSNYSTHLTANGSSFYGVMFIFIRLMCG